ncbi:MAG: cytochrome c oxidase subunit 3 [Acidibacillus sp.]|nr:cytochrome c oxidase subunit 3 [Sulfoacidibacillus ferrooxidans]MCY0894393.1 cytochrome c oxidase subunit 3 [Acidibacillus sp.]
MTDQQGSQVSTGPVMSAKVLRQNRFGLLFFITSQLVPYFMLINDRFVLADTYVSPRLDPLLGGLLPSLLLLLGNIPVWRAVQAIAKGSLTQMKHQLQLVTIIGIVAMITMVWPIVDHRYDAISPFGEIHLVSLGLGGFFTLVSLLVLLGVMIRSTKGLIGPKHYFGVEATAWVWSFNTISWLALYIVVYFI